MPRWVFAQAPKRVVKLFRPSAFALSWIGRQTLPATSLCLAVSISRPPGSKQQAGSLVCALGHTGPCGSPPHHHGATDVPDLRYINYFYVSYYIVISALNFHCTQRRSPFFSPYPCRVDFTLLRAGPEQQPSTSGTVLDPTDGLLHSPFMTPSPVTCTWTINPPCAS